jgi:thiol-disulfide isomerase/thioredoxin
MSGTWLDQFGGIVWPVFHSSIAYFYLYVYISLFLSIASASAFFLQVPGSLIDNSGKSVPLDRLADKIVGIYFSAHWCPPCRRFTPELASFHKTLAAQNKPFEVVFVSADKYVSRGAFSP